MRFDDRLATVLRHRATGERAARTQFRQLLDLLGSRTGPRDQTLLAAAWLRLGALGEFLPASERAAMVREPGLRFRNPELAARLAEDEAEVAIAALSHAEFSDKDWQALIPRLPVRARGFLRLRRDMPKGAVRLLDRLGIHDRALPMPAAYAGTSPDPTGERILAPAPGIEVPPSPPARPTLPQRPTKEALAPSPQDSAIGTLVKRIEAFRLARNGPPASPGSPRLPIDGDHIDGGQNDDRHAGPTQHALAAFAFTTDADGRVDWADAGVAPMITGKRLGDETVPANLLMRHQPLRNLRAVLSGAPKIAGEWVLDAAPRFSAAGGQFYGYAGKFRRPAGNLGATPAANTNNEADRIRQLLHELRTPVNAIQGFSEIIQQQLFGPTPHEYRALAATIASDSARILAGFDELDRLARLETGALELEQGATDFRAMIERISAQLQETLTPRTAAFDISLDDEPCLVALAPPECEALAWRLLASIATSVSAGETLQLVLEQDAAHARLCCQLPASLSGADDVFSASARTVAGSLSAGMFGPGFALRLAWAEARGAGGDLTRVENWLMLSLPILAKDNDAPSDNDEKGENGETIDQVAKTGQN